MTTKMISLFALCVLLGTVMLACGGAAENTNTASTNTTANANTKTAATPAASPASSPTSTASSGGDIGVHASISVAQALLAAGIVDELRLVVAPAITGRGRRLLEQLPPIRLEPLRNATSPTGYVLVDYRVLNS